MLILECFFIIRLKITKLTFSGVEKEKRLNLFRINNRFYFVENIFILSLTIYNQKIVNSIFKKEIHLTFDKNDLSIPK